MAGIGREREYMAGIGRVPGRDYMAGIGRVPGRDYMAGIGRVPGRDYMAGIGRVPGRDYMAGIGRVPGRDYMAGIGRVPGRDYMAGIGKARDYGEVWRKKHFTVCVAATKLDPDRPGGPGDKGKTLQATNHSLCSLTTHTTAVVGYSITGFQCSQPSQASIQLRESSTVPSSQAVADQSLPLAFFVRP
ncbi:hypothetical protein E2P81_ATG09457 [Venturia nashicola]|nr:hypothetical protein E2P81_ATG09457 [Venturia nashicola]